MEKFKSELLDLIEEKELYVVCKNVDMDFFLNPMKKKPELYKKYTKQLGRLDKKSPLVQKFMPKYACDLYKKGDEAYSFAFGLALSGLKRQFEDACKKCIGDKYIDDIRSYEIDKLVDLFQQLSELNDLLFVDMSSDLYVVLLKLVGVVFDDKKTEDLSIQINSIIEQNSIKELHKKEIEEAIKRYEKELNSRFEQEKGKYQKEKKKISKENGELKKQVDSLKRTIQEFKLREIAEREKIVSEWNKTAEAEIESKRKEQEQKLSQMYKKELADMRSRIAEEKRKEEDILKDSILAFKERNQVEQVELEKEISGLKTKKENLQLEVEDLNNEIEVVKKNLEIQKDIEREYFENIDKRIFEKKIDDEFVKKLKFGTEKQSSLQMLNNKPSEAVWIYQKELKKENVEECEPVNSLTDFEADLRDNVTIYFDEAADISITVTSALVLGKSLIFEQSVVNVIAECISAITGASRPYCIKVHDSLAVDMKELIREINELENQTILIEGVLDKYDEVLFTTVCEECKNKNIIFSVADIENLKLCSKVIDNYAIVLDIEKYYTYESSEKLLIAFNDISIYREEINLLQCKNYFDKFFRSLITKKIIGKKIAIDFSKMLFFYFRLIGKEMIFEVMKKSILHCCDIEDDKDVEKILSRVGLM